MSDEHGTAYDHLDHAQLMEAMYNVRREATKVVDQARSILDALLIHNQDPDAHIDLRNTISQLTVSLDEGLTSHDSGENSHPFLLNRILELENLIQKLRDDMGPAINQAIMTHNLDPEAHPHIQQYVKDYNDAHNDDPNAHGAAFDQHDRDENAHANIITEIREYIENHDNDENAHKVLFEYLEKADIFRYSRIGEVMPGHLMGAYGQNTFIVADGRFVDVSQYPELKKKIDDGHLFTRDNYHASYPGVWSHHVGTIYIAPNYSDGGDRFMRFSTNDQLAGLKESDAMQAITGSFRTTTASGQQSGAFKKLTFTHYGELLYTHWHQIRDGIWVQFDSSLVVTPSSETRPKSIYQLPVIYLGTLA